MSPPVRLRSKSLPSDVSRKLVTLGWMHKAGPDQSLHGLLNLLDREDGVIDRVTGANDVPQ
jgi:hypothetical protein